MNTLTEQQATALLTALIRAGVQCQLHWSRTPELRELTVRVAGNTLTVLEDVADATIRIHGPLPDDLHITLRASAHPEVQTVSEDAFGAHQLMRRTMLNSASEIHHPAEAWDNSPSEDPDGLNAMLSALAHATRAHKTEWHGREYGTRSTSWVARAAGMDHRLDVEHDDAGCRLEYTVTAAGGRTTAQLEETPRAEVWGPLRELLENIHMAKEEVLREHLERQALDEEIPRQLRELLAEIV